MYDEIEQRVLFGLSGRVSQFSHQLIEFGKLMYIRRINICFFVFMFVCMHVRLYKQGEVLLLYDVLFFVINK